MVRGFRGFDGLFSISGWWVMEKMVEYEYGKSPEGPWEFLTYLQHFWHNFWTRNSRNLIKGSKNAYFSLESRNTVSHNIGV